MKGHLNIKELEKYKKADLQKLAEELGVSTEGTIKELAERCAEVEVEIPDESELTEEEKEAAEQAAAEWAEDEDSILAAKIAVKIRVTFSGGVYADTPRQSLKDKELDIDHGQK